ncbi:unnamed protein product [Dicrocoelium dendriticum]|nr:unnamed protein product [Dicrocoelium dendriticum]
MPFLKGGRLAITRTKKYLDSGRIILNDAVKIIAIHHVSDENISSGCMEFIKWFLPPLQFKNPNVQILTFKNICPTPFIQVFMENKEELMVDCSFRKSTEIYDHLKSILSKTQVSTATPTPNEEYLDNPANFGTNCSRQCICEIYRQVPCSFHGGRPHPWPGLEPQLPVIEGLTDSIVEPACSPSRA